MAETQKKETRKKTRSLGRDLVHETVSGFVIGTVSGYYYHFIKAVATTTTPSFYASAAAGYMAALANSWRVGGVLAMFSGLDFVAKTVVYHRMVQRDLTLAEEIGISSVTAGLMLVPRHGFARASVATLPFAALFAHIYGLERPRGGNRG